MGQQSRILLTGQHIQRRAALTPVLGQAGYEVRVEDNFEDVSKASPPDAIIASVFDESEIGNLARLRQSSRRKRHETPVIVSGKPSWVTHSFQAGAADFVSDHCDNEELLHRVRIQLKHGRNATLCRERAYKLEAELSKYRKAEQARSLGVEVQAERFQVGGTLRPDAPCYVERKADGEIFHELNQGHYCYVLTSRQMGKSSLMARTAHRLKEQNVNVVTLDLTSVGQNLTSDQWYYGLITRLGWQLNLEDELDDFWWDYSTLSPVQRLVGAIQKVILVSTKGRLVIFVDEIDAVRSLQFSADEFFAAIRECYNRRAQERIFDRVTFCIMGVATPENLIRDPRSTPFNISRRIELEDFSREEAAPLTNGLNRPAPLAEQLFDRVFHWTQGHPYLTLRMCRALQNSMTVSAESDVDQLCEQVFLSKRAREQDDNLLYVRQRLMHSNQGANRLLEFYQKIRDREAIPDDPANPLVNELELAGLIREANGQLNVRNLIYERVFEPEWIQTLFSAN